MFISKFFAELKMFDLRVFMTLLFSRPFVLLPRIFAFHFIPCIFCLFYFDSRTRFVRGRFEASSAILLKKCQTLDLFDGKAPN